MARTGTLTAERILEATEEVLRRHSPAKATVVGWPFSPGNMSPLSWYSSPNASISSNWRVRWSRWTAGCTHVSACEQSGGKELGKLAGKVAIGTGGALGLSVLLTLGQATVLYARLGGVGKGYPLFRKAIHQM
jgi:hypothetical protein